MYRLLAAKRGRVRERRNQRSHPCYTKPELAATGLDQSRVLGHHPAPGAQTLEVLVPVKGLLDIFSR